MSNLIPSPNSSDYRCTICLEQITAENLKTLPCSHQFHTQCINEWLENHETCPLCMSFVFNNSIGSTSNRSTNIVRRLNSVRITTINVGEFFKNILKLVENYLFHFLFS